MKTDDATQTFRKNGYVVAREFVSNPALAFLFDYASKSARFGSMTPGDEQIPATPCRYADPFMESLLEMLVPKAESITSLKLFPTYSYFRVYKTGDVLKRHQDRPACEISLTLNLGFQAEKPWPIWLEVNGEARPTTLEPGDALFYKGVELPHWREPFTGENSAQVFLHYVNQDGQYKDWMYDKRLGLSTSPMAQRVLGQFKPL